MSLLFLWVARFLSWCTYSFQVDEGPKVLSLLSIAEEQARNSSSASESWAFLLGQEMTFFQEVQGLPEPQAII